MAVNFDRNVIKPGVVFGEDVEIPKEFEHLKGWLVYSANLGFPQLMDPAEQNAHDAFKLAGRSVEQLLKQRFNNPEKYQGARLWSPIDFLQIVENIVKAGHADKAQLDLRKVDNQLAAYWGQYCAKMRGLEHDAMLERHGAGTVFAPDDAVVCCLYDQGYAKQFNIVSDGKPVFDEFFVKDSYHYEAKARLLLDAPGISLS